MGFQSSINTGLGTLAGGLTATKVVKGQQEQLKEQSFNTLLNINKERVDLDKQVMEGNIAVKKLGNDFEDIKYNIDTTLNSKKLSQKTKDERLEAYNKSLEDITNELAMRVNQQARFNERKDYLIKQREHYENKLDKLGIGGTK